MSSTEGPPPSPEIWVPQSSSSHRKSNLILQLHTPRLDSRVRVRVRAWVPWSPQRRLHGLGLLVSAVWCGCGGWAIWISCIQIYAKARCACLSFWGSAERPPTQWKRSEEADQIFRRKYMAKTAESPCSCSWIGRFRTPIGNPRRLKPFRLLRSHQCIRTHLQIEREPINFQMTNYLFFKERNLVWYDFRFWCIHEYEFHQLISHQVSWFHFDEKMGLYWNQTIKTHFSLCRGLIISGTRERQKNTKFGTVISQKKRTEITTSTRIQHICTQQVASRVESYQLEWRKTFPIWIYKERRYNQELSDHRWRFSSNRLFLCKFCCSFRRFSKCLLIDFSPPHSRTVSNSTFKTPKSQD